MYDIPQPFLSCNQLIGTLMMNQLISAAYNIIITTHNPDTPEFDINEIVSNRKELFSITLKI